METGPGALLPQKTTRSRDPRAGQSTIEFALSLFFVLGMIFFMLQAALSFAVGNYVHYATFLAARAYQAAGPSVEDQRQRAREVITRMLKRTDRPGVDRWPSILKGEGGGGNGAPVGASIGGLEGFFNATDKTYSWAEGVRYAFRSRLFLMPIGVRQGSVEGERGEFTLVAESWLGREPSYDECAEALGSKGWEFDNGC